MRRMLIALMVAAGVVAGCQDAGQTPVTTAPVAQRALPDPQATKVVPPAAQPAPPAAKADSFVATKTSRIFFHSSELNTNGGGANRLRACELSSTTAEVSILDFDRAALKTFLAANSGKQVSAKLVLAIRDLNDDVPGKLELASIVSAVDWNQGDKMQERAAKGEVCASAAQFGVSPWTAGDGKAVKSLRELIFAGDGKVKTRLNGHAAAVSVDDKGKFVEIALDDEFLAHLANEPNCRGIVVFTRSDNARISFSSRTREGREPRIVFAAR